MTPIPLLREVFQLGYVATNIDAAVGIFKQRYGVHHFLRSGIKTIPLIGGESMTLSLAFAWLGPTMIEIIEPVGGSVNIYRRHLPESGAPRLHHIGVRLHSDAQWQAMREAISVSGLSTLLEVQVPTTRALYIDTYAELGHYTEYLYYSDVPNSTLPHIPQNIVPTSS
jgi:hypothetical protein